MVDSLLKPLSEEMKKHGACLFPLPTTDLRPGVLLNSSYEVLDHLTDLQDKTGRNFFSPVGDTPTISELIPASFVISELHTSLGAGAELGAGFSKIATLRAAARISTGVTLRFGPVKLRRIQVGLDAIGKPSYLEGLDYCSLANQNLDWKPFKIVGGMMKKRKLLFSIPRPVEIAQALVYAESVTLTFEHSREVDFKGALNNTIPVDLEAGVSIETGKGGSVSWTNGDLMPLAFLPVRYAYDGKNFVLTKL